MPLDIHIQSFIAYLKNEKRYSGATIKAYLSDLNQFYAFLRAQKISYDDVTTKIFRHYIQTLLAQRISRVSISRKIAATKHFYTYLVIQDMIAVNPIETISLPTVKKRLPEVLYAKELTTLLDTERESTFANRRLQLILELLYGCGIRVSELIKIKPDEIYTQERLILIHGKGNKERYVPFGKHVVEALHHYYEAVNQRGFDVKMQLLVNDRGGKLTTRGVSYLLEKETKRLGLTIALHPHVFRHTFATDMLNEGANLREVQEMLGHAHLSSTQIYTHVSTAKLQNEYLNTHPRAIKRKNNSNKSSND